jgi:glycine/D-amino acid oxidase-like deaminating enzyme
MKVAILGGGVIGVTSAYYLSLAGHEVTLIDRQQGAGLETSFANAGEISPGYASPWAAPDVPRKALKWLFMEHAPLILKPRFDCAMLSWLAALLGNCTARRYVENKARMVRLAEYSRDQLREVREATGIAYDERMRGTLQLRCSTGGVAWQRSRGLRIQPPISPAACGCPPMRRAIVSNSQLRWPTSCDRKGRLSASGKGSKGWSGVRAASKPP